MPETAAAAPATVAAGTSTPDPLDTFEIDDVLQPETGDIPEHMMLGGPEKSGAEPVESVGEKPVGEAEPAKETEPAEATLPEGYTRDTLGRVHGPDGKIVKKADVEQLLATASQQASNTEVKPEPFKYRYNGQNYEAEGFEYNPADGSVMVKPDHVGVLRDALNTKHIVAESRDINAQLRQQVATLTQQVEQGAKGKSASEARADALSNALSRIFEIQDDTQFAVEVFNLRESFPTLLSKAEAAYWRQQAEAAKQAPKKEAVPEAQRQPQRPSASALPERAIAVQTTQEYVERLKLDHAFRDLTPENWQQLGTRFERTPYAFLRPATTEDATKYGVEVGEVVFDSTAFHTDVQEYVSTLRTGRATAEQRAKLAAENARKTQSSVSAPPTPGGGRAPAKTGAKPITNKEELDDWWESTDL